MRHAAPFPPMEIARARDSLGAFAPVGAQKLREGVIAHRTGRKAGELAALSPTVGL